METVREKIEFWKFMEILQTKEFDPQNEHGNRKRIKFSSQSEIDAIDNITEFFSDYIDSLDICCLSVKKADIEEYFIKEKRIDDKRLEFNNKHIHIFGFQTTPSFSYDQTHPSFSVSPYIWYLDKLLKNQKANFTEYKNFTDSLKNEELRKIFENEEKNILEKICSLQKLVFSEIPFLRKLNDDSKIVEEHIVYYDDNPQNKTQEHESQLFDSHIVEDLELVEGAATLPEILTDYILSPVKNTSKPKTDIKRSKEEIKRILSADKYPLGKWPSKHNPALMQQIAVNYAIDDKNRLFSVNGPPGTGKTTLLKEIIADTIVKRGIELAKLPHPDDAFTRAKSGDEEYYRLKESLLPYSILIASCNNGAVENITTELPISDGILEDLKEKPYKDFFDPETEHEKAIYENGNYDIYFSAIAKNYFSSLQKGPSAKKDVWGIISAPLGKKKNLTKFFFLVVQEYISLTDKVNTDTSEKLFSAAKEEFSRQLDKVKRIAEKLEKYPSDEFLEKAISDDPDIQAGIQTGQADNITKEFNEAREALFCKAVNLQKAFALASVRLGKNLSLLSRCWGFTDDENEKLDFKTKEEVFTDCFLSLFLLVPVVSSTFASMQRMLKYMTSPEKIGLLIIDEAGQASPQQAAGAIFRSRKAVVVGDPMQVEPVVTANPEVYEDFLNETFSNDISHYFPRTLSVQTFADSINTYGSEVNEKWVGCPLVVHRRCTSPMFDISNELSYNYSMIKKTAAPSPELKSQFLLSESCWIDVQGTEKGDKNHFVQEQYDIVKRIIEGNSQIVAENIFIITPFRTVKEEFEKRKKTKIKTGTVHTFQGKEANEVFFVLGCDESFGAQGAVSWVNANIVNVAVTRAKHRLYVVGDWNVWSENLNIKMIQKHIEKKSIEDIFPEIKGGREMVEDVKTQLSDISEKIDEIYESAYREGRDAAMAEIREKMEKEGLPVETIGRIFPDEQEQQLSFESFNNEGHCCMIELDSFDFEITLKNKKNDKNENEWLNFSVNETEGGWNQEHGFSGSFKNSDEICDELKIELDDFFRNLSEDEKDELFSDK